jgi:hypothetical protein
MKSKMMSRMGLLSHEGGEGKHYCGFGREGRQLEDLRLDGSYKNNEMAWADFIWFRDGINGVLLWA